VKHEKDPEPGTMVTMRYPKTLLDKIDRFMRDFEKINPGLKISRADAIRILVTRGLEQSQPLE